jgi:hypothetical protein
MKVAGEQAESRLGTGICMLIRTRRLLGRGRSRYLSLGRACGFPVHVPANPPVSRAGVGLPSEGAFDPSSEVASAWPTAAREMIPYLE